MEEELESMCALWKRQVLPPPDGKGHRRTVLLKKRGGTVGRVRGNEEDDR